MGIDSAGRPALVEFEYKRRHDENIINQDLDCLAWLDNHPVDSREFVREKLGGARVTEIDFARLRLICIAGEVLDQDEVAVASSRRPIEPLHYRRRHGDSHMMQEWVYGGDGRHRLFFLRVLGQG